MDMKKILSTCKYQLMTTVCILYFVLQSLWDYQW